MYNQTKESLRKFISQLNFTNLVNRALDNILKATRARDEAKLKNIDADVALIKEFLRANIGSTWEQVTDPSDANQLNIDFSLSNWGGGRNPRAHTPWAQMARAMSGEHCYSEYVKEKMGEYCPWHKWRV